MSAKEMLQLRVRSVSYEAENILGFELVYPGDADLPAFTAGAHIDVRLPGDVVRQYSLCNDPRERHRYCIAVLKETAGRGGSRALHEAIRPGDQIEVSAPRNHFPLAQDAAHHFLLAGGIGVAPMMAMLKTLEARGASYELHYCTRAPGKTAFRAYLAPLAARGRVHLHHDGGDPQQGLDLVTALRRPRPGTHLYICGPAGFMAAAKAASAHWPAGTVHVEYFAAPAEAAAPRAIDEPFTVRITSTGEEFEVPADKSIVDVLRAHDVHVDTSCREGYCGTCLTRYVEGEPEHRDVVLDTKDRQEFVLICCARSKSDLLVLDL